MHRLRPPFDSQEVPRSPQRCGARCSSRRCSRRAPRRVARRGRRQTSWWCWMSSTTAQSTPRPPRCAVMSIAAVPVVAPGPWRKFRVRPAHRRPRPPPPPPAQALLASRRGAGGHHDDDGRAGWARHAHGGCSWQGHRASRCPRPHELHGKHKRRIVNPPPCRPVGGRCHTSHNCCGRLRCTQPNNYGHGVCFDPYGARRRRRRGAGASTRTPQPAPPHAQHPS